MKLQNHLDETGETHEAFAARIGMSRVYVTQIANETREPSFNVMRKIHFATNGAVSLADYPEKQEGAA